MKEIILTGTIINIMMPTYGTSKAGKEWSRQEFILKTEEQYPRTICVSTTNLDALEKFKVDSKVNVSVNIESREYNEKWYTEVRAWKILAA